MVNVVVVGKFVVVKVPVTEPALTTPKVSFAAGVKLLTNETLSVPFRLALPVTLSTSYWVPAVVPPNSAFNVPPAPCT